MSSDEVANIVWAWRTAFNSWEPPWNCTNLLNLRALRYNIIITRSIWTAMLARSKVWEMGQIKRDFWVWKTFFKLEQYYGKLHIHNWRKNTERQWKRKCCANFKCRLRTRLWSNPLETDANNRSKNAAFKRGIIYFSSLSSWSAKSKKLQGLEVCIFC